MYIDIFNLHTVYMFYIQHLTTIAYDIIIYGIE